jgi:hypothetical protein
MQIHVARQSAQIGVFTVEEIQQGLVSGRFLLSDLAWRDGMATWVALGDWAEFRSIVPPAAVPASPVDAPAAVVTPSEVTVPWEKGKSIGSFFATLKGGILTPHTTFAVGRYEFGTWLIFSYFVTLLLLPITIYAQLAQADMFKELAESLQKLHNPIFDGMAQSFLKQQDQPKWIGIVGVVFGSLFAPLFNALIGVADWVGYKIFRRRVEIQRAIVAGMIGAVMMNIIFTPVVLLMAKPILYMVGGVLVFIPMLIITFRAKGAVVGMGAWWAFAANAVMVAIFACCCGCAIFAIGAAAASAFRG